LAPDNGSLLQRIAQAGVRPGVVGVERQRLPVAGLGVLQAVQFVKGYAQVGVGFGIVGGNR